LAIGQSQPVSTELFITALRIPDRELLAKRRRCASPSGRASRKTVIQQGAKWLSERLDKRVNARRDEWLDKWRDKWLKMSLMHPPGRQAALTNGALSSINCGAM
jgi:hypothetical protein